MKNWYYGPLVQRNNAILVFPSITKPSKRVQGKTIKYAVGPFKSKQSAISDAKGFLRNNGFYPEGGMPGQIMYNPVDTVRVMLKPSRKKPEKTIRAPYDVSEYMKKIAKEMAIYDREYMKVIYVDIKNQVIGVENVSEGTIDSAIAHPREIMKGAMLANAAAMILVHNHPSGNPEPSKEDISVMKRIQQVSELAGIPLLDFVIIGEDRDFSAKEAGILT